MQRSAAAVKFFQIDEKYRSIFQGDEFGVYLAHLRLNAFSYCPF